MHGLFAGGKRSPVDWMLMDACLSEEIQAMAQESVARSREIYRVSASAAQGGARLFVEVAETAWGSAKLLNDKLARNVASNAAAAFGAAEACAKAGSLMELATLQGNFLQQLLATTSEQTREFIDLSTRATQRVLETMHGASARLLRTDF
jgi:hypothetical protein